MALILFSGRPRTGKTLSAVRFIGLNYLQRGIKCYPNIDLNFEGEYEREFWKPWKKKYYDQSLIQPKWKRLIDLKDVSSCVILMDEGHIYMNARKWEQLPEEFMWKLFQHGKDRIDIVMTVQSQRRLDTIARELIDYWYNVQRFPKAKTAVDQRSPWFISYQEYDIDEDPYKQNPLGRPKRFLTIWWGKKWYRRYNTFEKLTNGETKKVT